jgi:hypothetical protein
MMGWLHKTRLWYLLAAAYVVACWKVPTALPLTGFQLLLRVIAALASSANVWISDGYHNTDRRGGDAYTPPAETTWLRFDYVGISCVLTSLCWLWASNMAYIGGMKVVCVLSGICTAAIATIAALVVPKKNGHRAVKYIMAFQFAGLLNYLVQRMVRTPCRLNAIIFWVYAPGLILYVLKKPKSAVFGFHEYFHTSVLAGHLMSMACDLRDIASPCARSAACFL